MWTSTSPAPPTSGRLRENSGGGLNRSQPRTRAGLLILAELRAAASTPHPGGAVQLLPGDFTAPGFAWRTVPFAMRPDTFIFRPQPGPGKGADCAYRALSPANAERETAGRGLSNQDRGPSPLGRQWKGDRRNNTEIEVSGVWWEAGPPFGVPPSGLGAASREKPRACRLWKPRDNSSGGVITHGVKPR
ncbi:MAG: hypothetical protein GMKNLPBB_01369 [Myxococcota bacterium]|nr:hypothetical protein [Myxococcota bacterium]